MVFASARILANSSTVRGPISNPLRPRGISRAGTVRGRTSALASSAATTSCGSSSSVPFACARSITARTSSNRSRSTRLSPISPPEAAINVNAIAPPINSASARSTSASNTPSLSDTFAPPRTVTYGRSGSVRSRPRTSTSRWRSRPATAVRPDARMRSGRATTLACARCAAPKASFTYASASSASCPANRSSLDSSPGWNRRFSSSTTSPGSMWPQTASGPSPTTSSSAITSTPSSSPSRSATGPRRRSSLRLPFGLPRCDATTSAAPRVDQLAERGDGRADPHVVGDPAALERHVEVGADEDPAAGDVAELVERAERH